MMQRLVCALAAGVLLLPAIGLAQSASCLELDQQGGTQDCLELEERSQGQEGTGIFQFFSTQNWDQQVTGHFQLFGQGLAPLQSGQTEAFLAFQQDGVTRVFSLKRVEQKLFVVESPKFLLSEARPVELTGYDMNASTWHIPFSLHKNHALSPPIYQLTVAGRVFRIGSKSAPPLVLLGRIDGWQGNANHMHFHVERNY